MFKHSILHHLPHLVILKSPSRISGSPLSFTIFVISITTSVVLNQLSVISSPNKTWIILLSASFLFPSILRVSAGALLVSQQMCMQVVILTNLQLPGQNQGTHLPYIWFPLQ